MCDDSLEPFPHFATNAIHVGNHPEQWASKSVTPLISPSTTFKLKSPREAFEAGFTYSRKNNPSRQVLEECLASLEDAKFCVTFSSGMAAIASTGHLAKNSDHVLCMHDVYGGTQNYFKTVAADCGVETSFVDIMTSADLKHAMRPNTKLIWLESPTNPLLNIANIRKLSKHAHKKNPEVLVVVDNTFASPYLQRPLDLGADIVVHSVTKYINGHSDVTMGAAMVNSKVLHDRLKALQSTMGAVPSPHDCFLANRGVKTLNLRMEQHEKNAMAVARELESNSRVSQVLYPGLESHPGHKRAKRQMVGFGGMVSFYINGDNDAAETFLTKVKVLSLANSLGGYESLCSQPATMSHESLTPEEREKLGITDNLIRLAVGLESEETLLEDIRQALVKAVPNPSKKVRR